MILSVDYKRFEINKKTNLNDKCCNNWDWSGLKPSSIEA